MIFNYIQVDIVNQLKIAFFFLKVRKPKMKKVGTVIFSVISLLPSSGEKIAFKIFI